MADPVPASAGLQENLKGRRTVRWVALAVGALVLIPGIIMSRQIGKDPTIIPSPLIGKPAPDFVFTALDGSKLRSSDLRGRPYVLNFWASWCPPCLKEQPDLADFYRRWHPRGVELVGVVFQDSKENVTQWQRERGGDWPVVMDPDHASIDFGVARPPETYIVDAQGRVAVKISGPIGRGGLDDILERVSSAG
jgi:cytochrome c biogenesis protein CcmG, thiol:disulfide interchange protein DsbE